MNKKIVIELYIVTGIRPLRQWFKQKLKFDSISGVSRETNSFRKVKKILTFPKVEK